MRNVASGSVIVLAICFCFSVVACASTGVRNINLTGPEGWRAVIELRRGTDISVMVDCAGGRTHEACTSTSRLPQGDSPSIRAITATHVEADAESLLVRPDYEDTTVLQVPRALVITVYVGERESSLGTLIGFGVGMGFCAILGVFGYDLNLSGQLLFTGICGGSGAGIGYAMYRKSGPFTWIRVYQRADPATATGNGKFGR